VILIWKRASSGGVKYVQPFKLMAGDASYQWPLAGTNAIMTGALIEDGQWSRFKYLLHSVDLNK
jgi:hypothetical protein